MTIYLSGERLVRVNSRSGRIVARTIEQTPRYDVRMDDGTIAVNVTANKLEDAR